MLRKMDRRRAFWAAILIAFLALLGAGAGWLVGQLLHRQLMSGGAGIGVVVALILIIIVLSDGNND